MSSVSSGETSNAPRPHPRYSVLTVRSIVWTAIIVVFLAAIVVLLLLQVAGDGGEEQRARLESIRTAGTVVLGTGGAVALLLAARRQRSTEIALWQKDRDQTHQEMATKATQDDLVERRVTEIYAKAAEQLGSDKAPVRLAALYGLERLGQDNPRHRQTVVNLICAYLRMPYNPPPDDLVYSTRQGNENREVAEELEVRTAAQEILRNHLRTRGYLDSPSEHWPGIDINLMGAVLVGFNLNGCTLRTGLFGRAKFVGRTEISGATFTGGAFIHTATFTSAALFDSTTFQRTATFRNSEFPKWTIFRNCTFGEIADFGSASFQGDLTFEDNKFNASQSPELAKWLQEEGNVDEKLVNFDDTRFAGEIPRQVREYTKD